MTKHSHDHHHDHKHHKEHQPTKPRPVHKDWRLWVVVWLMIAAIIGYVVTMDESIVPGFRAPQPEVPAEP